jgi:hypothetical protein
MTRGGMLEHETDEAYPCPAPAITIVTWCGTLNPHIIWDPEYIDFHSHWRCFE